LYADTYHPFGPCLSDLAFNCLGSRMRSISSNCVARQFVGDGLLPFLPKPDQLDILHPSPPRLFKLGALDGKSRSALCGNQVVHNRSAERKGHVELVGEPPQAWIVQVFEELPPLHVLSVGVNLPKPKFI
jgi:hypothetical protein